MKNIVLGLAIGLAVSASAAQAGLWEKVTTMGQETKDAVATYTVEASGWNVRATEWIPEFNPGYRCVFVGGTQKGGTACYPAAK